MPRTPEQDPAAAEDPRPAKLDSETVDEILDCLVEMSVGECSIDEERIVKASESDTRKAEILTALLFLHEDLIYKEQLHVATIAELERKTDDLVQSQELAEELAMPLIKIGRGVVLVPLIGPLGDALAGALTERVMSGVTRERARFLILDLTGVPTIDPGAIGVFEGLTRGVRLLGVECVVAGVRPQVALALADAGLEHLAVVTDVERALTLCRS